MTNLYF